MPPTANGPASTPNVTHNRPDQIRLSSLFIPLSLSLSLVSVMGSDATLSSVGEEDYDRMWARGLPIF